ncbi:hypothetical protein AB5I41_23640 [Sphingomonas sp. MMS24-JH45]
MIADGRLENGRIVRGNGTSYTYDAASQSARRPRVTTSRTVWVTRESHGISFQRYQVSYAAEQREKTSNGATMASSLPCGSPPRAMTTTATAPSHPTASLPSLSGRRPSAYDSVGRQVGQTDYNARGHRRLQSSADVRRRRARPGGDGKHVFPSARTRSQQAPTTITGSERRAMRSGRCWARPRRQAGTTIRSARPRPTPMSGGRVRSSRPRRSRSRARRIPSPMPMARTGGWTGWTCSDARPRTVTITSDLSGEAIRRAEVDNNSQESDPHDILVSLCGPRDRPCGQRLQPAGQLRGIDHDAGDGAGKLGVCELFQRQTWRFDKGTMTPITSYDQGGDGGGSRSAAGRRCGIAAQLWGDGGLWYKLASANGLTGSSVLVWGRCCEYRRG